jgi:lysophospholipase L1-like esterase
VIYTARRFAYKQIATLFGRTTIGGFPMRLICFASILLILSSSVALFAADDADRHPDLALGDSVSFGFIQSAGFEYVNPQNFIGFPAYVGQPFKLRTSNAACPGETSGSFLSSTAPDDGCRFYRSQVPLHVSYTSTQLDFALSFLKSHPDTRLVSIGLGANDVLLLRTQCANDPACIARGLPRVLAAVETNLATILGDLREAGFKGIAVVVNYYSVDYSDVNETAITAALNQALAAASARARTVVADVFTAFQAVAGPAGGHTCNVGLLNASPQDQFTCDIHPSQSGQKLIARTVEQSYIAARENAP